METQRGSHIKSHTALLALAVIATPLAAGADALKEVGQVATLSGHAVAERPGQPPRSLECRDPIYEGDRIVTDDQARVGVLVGDLLAHVSKGSALRVGETTFATADLALEKGAVRVIDPRESGKLARLGVLDARARVMGNDLEGYVFAEKTGGYAMLCEWDAPLPVSRGAESAVAQPGECVVAKRKEPLYVARGHDQRLAWQDLCALGPVIGSLALHLSPTDVAAAPLLGPWSGLPPDTDLPARSPCDPPGSCSSIVEPPPTGGGFPGSGGSFPGPFSIVEPPPTGGGFPGSGGAFPGP